MPRQSLLWTALPNGLTPDGRGARLSVLVSPRLDPEDAEPVLSSFRDFAAWPETLRRAALTVHAGAASIPLGDAHVDATLGVPDPATWRALLPGSTPVRPFAFRDRDRQGILSYDTVAIHGLAQRVYGRLAAAPDDELPTIAELLDDDDLAGLVAAVSEIDREFWSRAQGQRDVDAQRERWRENDFKGLEHPELARFQLFHTPASKATTQTVTPRDPRTAVTWRTYERAEIDAARWVRELDVHQIVAAMNQYPTLLRRLGLVLDFVVPRAELPTGADVPLSVSVELRPDERPAPSGGSPIPARAGGAPAASLVTRTRITRTAFAPVPRPASSPAEELRVRDGLLHLDPERFALLQADVDGAGHKLMNFARSLRAHAGTGQWRQVDPVTKLLRTAGAPALRTAGLMLVHRGRGTALGHAFDRNRELDEAVRGQPQAAGGVTPAALHAEDLVRGWRVDVWDRTTGRWRSLCERVATYDVGRGAVTLADVREEGTVRLAATSAADGSDPEVVRLHEALTVWNGWSLAARPVGRTVDVDDRALRDAEAEVPEGIPLRTAFVVAPGTLPKLRYGRSYAVRLRAVDLAGNSLPPSTGSHPGDEAAIAAATPFLRYEPVEPPAIALVGTGKDAVEEPAEGESMMRLAVRTLNDVFDDPAPTPMVARRWAVAPRTSATTAELHGALDGAAWGSAAQHALLVERDRELAQVPLELPSPLADPAQPVPAANYAILPPDATRLPYLPDPLCRSVAARLLNHPLIDAGESIVIPLYGDAPDANDRAWPDAAPFLVRVYEAEGERPRFDAASRTLLVPTPKAVRATLRLSTMLEPEALELLGVWHWIAEAERTPALRRRARRGRLWALTPWRDLEIVHAVQRPLLAPTITSLVPTRPAGVTWMRPGVDARVHRASTDRVELRAAWHEPRDVASAETPTDVVRTDVAFSVRVTDPLGYGGVVDHVVPDPADPDHIAFGPASSASAAEVRAARGRTHDFGDTRYRRVEYHLVATSRFREYMPRYLLVDEAVEEGDTTAPRTLEEHVTVAGPAVPCWVRSSAPPPAPEVLYVVPTFGWTRGADADGGRTSWRRGGGLRVWLDRPWNASGYGEMLAVVLPPAGRTTNLGHPSYEHTVTRWGNDPVWKSAFVSGVAPSARAFPLARTAPDPTGAWLPPGAPSTEADQPPGAFAVRALRHPGLAPGVAEGVVDVVPHDVFWDPDRRLWYCDIEVDFGGAYFPFVRLALARYQPVSAEGTHLSGIVVADVMALAPDRWLTVTRTSARERHVRVVGPTHTRSAGYDEAWTHRVGIINPAGQRQEVIASGISPTNVVEVWLEELAAGASEDFGWRRVADGAPTPELRPSSPLGGAVAKKTAAKTVAKGVAKTVAKGAAKTTQRRTAAEAERASRAHELVRRRDYDAVVAESLLDTVFEWPTLWSGSITLPASRTPGTRHRAVVAEYEEYLVDDAEPYDTPLERKERRLVFVEHVELD
jgi:hypothetical protein